LLVETYFMNRETSGGPPRRRFLLIPHTHWDREWYLPLEDFRYRLVRMLDEIMDILETDPSFRSFLLDGQSIILKDYDEIKPGNQRIRRHISEGRIQSGPWYVLPDEFLVSGESLIRNLERGRQMCRDMGGVPLNTGYLPDMFGHTAQMPQILRCFGIDQAVVWRGVPSEADTSFLWKAPDGSSVFTAFLPQGYGFAANLPLQPDLLEERLENLLEQIAGNDSTDIALFYGTDHSSPSPELSKALEAVSAKRPEWSFCFSGLEEWLETLRSDNAGLNTVEGELRSQSRSLILPGVVSARAYLKKQDFTASSLLEKYAEPLTALAGGLGGPEAVGFLDYAWGLLLENHPHDSICGCSVDQVHNEMETRYEKALQVGRRLVSESMSNVMSASKDRSGPGIVVFNPCGALQPGILTGEIETRRRHALALVMDNGDEQPLQILETTGPEKTFLDIVLPRAPALSLLSDLLQDELFGFYFYRLKSSHKGGRMEVRIDVTSSPCGEDAETARLKIEKELYEEGPPEVAVKVKKPARYRAAVQVPELPGHCVKGFPLVKRKRGRVKSVEHGPDYMENEHVRMQFEPGGTCLLTDKQNGTGYRCLRFVDVGDRGDTYNFDPLPEDRPLCEPHRVTLKPVTAGPVAAVMEIRHRFRIPEGLHSSRRSRSRKKVSLDLTTWITMYKDHPRVDFRTVFFNSARDHRLQAAVRLPYELDSIRVESAFAMVERSLQETQAPDEACLPDLCRELLGAEGTYSTSPQKTLTLARQGDVGIGIINRGMAEIDAVRLKGATRLAMTMVRSVGWLSRPDLAMRTMDAGPNLPAEGAQCARRFEWEYALMPFSEEAREADVVRASHAFAYPVKLFTARNKKPVLHRVINIDNPRVYVSALRPLENRGLLVRLANLTDETESFNLEPGQWWTRPQVVDLNCDPTEEAGVEASGDRVCGKIKGGRILTLRFDYKKQA